MSGTAERPTSRRVRVCLVAPSMDILGGQSVQARLLLERLRDSPHVSVSLLPINPRLPPGLRWLQRIKYVRTVVTSIAYVASLLRRLPACDVVHAFSASYWSFVLAPLPAMVIARMYGKRVVLNYHSGQAEDHFTRWRRVVMPAMRLPHEIVVPSGYLVAVFARFGLRARALPNFVETEELPFRARTPLRPVLLANRNFEPHYNVSCVLRAFAMVRSRRPDARLIVAGDGSERELLRSLTRELKLEGVEFTGPVSPARMAELYEASDIYVNASDIDNMPLSILEAFASGLPVVTTDAGGIPYVVTHERTALMVPRGDASGLALAVLRLLDDEVLAQRLIASGRAECDARYTWRAVRSQWEEFYQAIGGAAGGAANAASVTPPSVQRVRP
ncbi:MAG TPA: glycosyltransferase family 4 protein [Gemmatimonadaceae bacterium]|nr:glycosyltransferase family 4 protein [Gemmatimonadaceae bacterium]